MDIKNLYQTADWKTEKHVPVIDIGSAEKGKDVSVAVTVGKEIAHPNTTAHHISWIEVYFLPQGEKFPYQIGRFEFSCHGASTNGPDSSSVYTEPKASCVFKTEKSGTLIAVSYCNIHGLWQNSSEITIK